MNYAVILNWRNIEDTIHCVESLLTSNNENLNIILCDNDSQDDSLKKISDWLLSVGKVIAGNDRRVVTLKERDIAACDTMTDRPAIYLLQNDKNYGYAGGNNRGIRLAMQDPECKYIWMLNNDTEVTNTSYKALYNRMESDAQIGICGSALVLDDNRNKLQGVGGAFNEKLCISSHVLEGISIERLGEIESDNVDIDYIIGASMLIRKEAIEKIGLLSEDYFLYYEEIDFCLRLKKFFKIKFESNSIVYHKLGSTIKKNKSLLADYLSVKNRLIVAKKFYPQYFGIVWLSLLGVLFNRIKRAEFIKAMYVIKTMVYDAVIILLKYKSL